MSDLTFPPGRWRAAWVWADPATDDPTLPTERRTVAFHHRFALDGLPATAPARLAAVGRASWWVNGVEVGRGPVRSNPRRARWDDADVAPLLRVGDNVVAALVTFDGRPVAWSMPLPRSNDLAGGALAVELHLGDRVVGTDTTWRATVLAGWSATRGHGVSARGRELLDAGPLPDGWTSSVEPPAEWPPAVTRNAQVFGGSGRPTPPSFPGGPLAGRPISRPLPIDVALTPIGGAAWTADRVTVGTLAIDVEAPTDAELTVRVAERLDGDDRPEPTEDDASLTVAVPAGRHRVETVDTYGLRGLLVDPAGEITVHGLTVRERLHPVAGDHRVRCSDPLLERIWEVGRRTVSICSLDAYIDCPTREQRAWTGDSVVHQLVDLTTNDDWTLARWHPRLAASVRADGMLPMAVAGDLEATDLSIIPDWSLHWVHSVWNLYRHVGDRDEVAELLPVVETVCRWFSGFLDDHGVPTDVYGWVIIDWSSVHSDGTSAALAGLWGRALLELAEMAGWLRDHGRERWARAAHDRLRRGFERLWDADRRRYADTLVDGARLPMASQHGQAAAIVGGLAPVERHPRLVEVLTDEDALVHAAFSVPDGPSDPGSESPLGGPYLLTGHPEPWWDIDRQVVRAQPFFRYVVHDALAAAGRADLVAAACRDWAVLLDRCPTSWSETWYGGTTSHGWSSTPTRDLIQHTLGVQPASPGFARARVAPRLGDLEWAEATTPTPHGPIRVRADAEAVTVESPVEVEIDVGDGRPPERRPPGRHVVPVARP